MNLRKPCVHGLYDPHFWEVIAGYQTLSGVVTVNCPGGQLATAQELLDAYNELIHPREGQ